MFKDITLGQFFPGDSLIHRLDPRTKIVAATVFIAALFLVRNLYGYLLVALFLAWVIGASGVRLRLVVRSLKPLWVIIVLTAVLNVFYTSGLILWQWGFLKITREGLLLAAFMVLRIVFLIAGTSMLTYTTSPIALTDGIESLLGPLKRLRFPVHELSMMMTIALRFIPTLIEETDKIMNAQKARGADFESGGMIRKAKALIPILVPLFVSAFRRADDLAVAMECRCYRGGENRTRMKQLRMLGRDYLAIAFMAALTLAVILINLARGGWRMP